MNGFLLLCGRVLIALIFVAGTSGSSSVMITMFGCSSSVANAARDTSPTGALVHS